MDLIRAMGETDYKTIKQCSSCVIQANDAKKIVSAIYPLICHYVSLHEKLVFDLMIAHRTMCRLLSVLLQTFCTLVSKVRNYGLITQVLEGVA